MMQIWRAQAASIPRMSILHTNVENNFYRYVNIPHEMESMQICMQQLVSTLHHSRFAVQSNTTCLIGNGMEPFTGADSP